MRRVFDEGQGVTPPPWMRGMQGFAYIGAEEMGER